MSAHNLCLGLSSSKADRSNGGFGQALPSLPALCTNSRQAAFPLPGWRSPVPRVGQTHSSHIPSASPPSFAPHLATGKREREEKGAVAKPRLKPLLSFPNMPSAFGPRQLPLPHPTAETANSTQCPVPRSLPQIQGQQGGAEGHTECRRQQPPPPWSSLLLLPTPSVSESNLRSPPALKIALPASPVSLATSFRIGYVVRFLEASRLGFPPHPPNSK